MSARSFGSLFMVASCAGAALGCYLVSLRVASERAALEDVETRIVLTQRDLRVLQTEIGTRGRLSQLERWNAGAFSLTAPAANQFVRGGFELAKLTQPEPTVDFEAPVVLASTPPAVVQRPLDQGNEDEAAQAPVGVSPRTLIHQASLKTETREVPARKVADLPQAAAPKSPGKPVTAAKPAQFTTGDKPGLAAAQLTKKSGPEAGSKAAAPTAKKTVDKASIAAAKSVTKPVRLARVDPLAPLAAMHRDKTRDAPTDR